MKVLKTVESVRLFVQKNKAEGKVLGFVPTMGALHDGHISLLKAGMKDCDVLIVSIFVNPLQFNDLNDLNLYPRTPEKDMEMLEDAGCDMVFMPAADEIYPDKPNFTYALGDLEYKLEGKFRPGHFQGVAHVVDRLFSIVTPDKAYFGVKDYQQVLIIKKMVSLTHAKVEIIPCATLREFDGLAMSSRNARLTPEQRAGAGVIYQTLSQVPEMAKKMDVKNVKDWVEDRINNTPFMQVEYFEMADPETLDTLFHLANGKSVGLFVAVFCGKVRLIDNLFFVF
ncbi:MAG: pantoate--beta-alanine ligase [Bacteroidetes bacterium HGW-Bacteroidetes-21]|jgi:pantoate--beta-alanine ligase|nr:MAG: pantoate--beta-alanine ligase [Bacteroidetes bacterium HGW-Bacteroidetes-21]